MSTTSLPLKTDGTLGHVDRFHTKLLKCGQDYVIAEGTIFGKKFAEISLAARLAQLATVRSNLDSAQEEKCNRKEKEFSQIKKEQDERNADLDFIEELLKKRKKQIDMMNEENDKINAMFVKRFDVLAKMESKQSEQEKALIVREKKLSRREKEVLDEERKTAEIRELLEQMFKKYSQPQPPPPKDDNLPPEFFIDNIFTLEVMEQPVVAADGFTYEKRCILEWFRTKRTSPTTGAVLTTELIPNHSLKSQINQWREKQART
jgi:hypothetical protein